MSRFLWTESMYLEKTKSKCCLTQTCAELVHHVRSAHVLLHFQPVWVSVRRPFTSDWAALAAGHGIFSRWITTEWFRGVAPYIQRCLDEGAEWHPACLRAINKSLSEKQETPFRKELPRKSLLSYEQETLAVCSHVWISAQLSSNGGEVAEGSTGLDLKTEDCGARPVSFRQDAPQDGAGQEHPFRSDNLERRGERKKKYFCLLYLIYHWAGLCQK